MKNYMDKFLLKGKVVYVAGGVGLLGAEVSKALATAGGKIVILDINKQKGKTIEKQINDAGYEAYYEYFDIGDLENAEASIDQLIMRYKSIDVWINASYPKTEDWPRSLEKMDLTYLRRNVDMHLNSCIWISRKVAMLMRESKTKGVIINFGSIYGIQANDLTIYEGTPMAGEMTYCAIKSGIINLTRYLASHFGRHGIRANSICPGGIFDNQNEIFVKNYEHKVLLGKLGTPEEIASVVLFLASDASSYMTGSTVMVDGGWSAI